jgi:hypothetical protein
MMPRKASLINEVPDKDANVQLQNDQKNEDEIGNLTRMLATVLNYLSDDELEEIDIE